MKKMRVASMFVQGGLLVAFAGGFYYFTQTQIAPTEVYTYSRDISVNTILQDTDLVKKVIPKDAITPNMITKKEDAIGKAVSTKVYPGEYVITQKLIEESEIDPFEKMDLSEYRKISLSVDMKDAVGGNLKKGDKIDLAFVDKGNNPNTGKEFVYSKTFLQDVLIYNVIDDGGRKYIDQTEGHSNIVNENGEVVESGALAVITLAVTGNQAEEIQARLEKGKIKIIGRFEDSADNSTLGYTLGEYSPVLVQPANPEQKK